MQIPSKVVEFPGIVYTKTKTREQKLPDTQPSFFLCNVENILEKSGLRTLGKLVKFTLKKKKKNPISQS